MAQENPMRLKLPTQATWSLKYVSYRENPNKM